ncbi:cytochrome P450 315a1, mitochondrial-like [Amphibalanus amphitrite]|uniref:cytochrome P450 315a1, mitochondrial-like n=1 Tax=Amphibalanus amphitrite TaxID=1232801 RepID=UPI001C90D8AA|nr:cytochrome P450 315a1, mitochondrial-like [Amphibalanus amphitrite]
MPGGRELAVLSRRLLSGSPRPQAAAALPRPLEAARPFAQIPRPRRPDGDHLADLARAGGPSRLHELVDGRHRQLGGLFVESIQGAEVVFVADSELIRQVLQRDAACPQFLVPQAWTVFNQLHGCQRGLFFMTGEHWKHHRRIMNNYLLKPSAHRHTAAFNQVVSGLLSRWENQLDGRVTRTEDELYTYSVEIMAAVLFGPGQSFGWVDGAPTEATDTRRFAALVRRIFSTSAALSTTDAAAAARRGTPEWREFEQAVQEGLDICRNYVERKLTEVEAQLAAGEPTTGIIAEMLQNGEDVSREEIVRIVADLFLAAGDTTAHSTSWALYQLGRDGALQRRLAAAVRRAVPAGSPTISSEQLERVPLVRAVVKETLRLYPVAPFLTRLIQSDTVIGGYHVPAGTPLCVSLFSSSRDSRYFPAPLQFLPERWLRPDGRGAGAAGCPAHGQHGALAGSAHTESGLRHRHACMPFAGGVRGCIGKRVAELQMQLLLARLVHQFQLGTENRRPAQFVMRMVGVMSDELQLTLRPRDD